jgi:hypothetical protein
VSNDKDEGLRNILSIYHEMQLRLWRYRMFFILNMRSEGTYMQTNSVKQCPDLKAETITKNKKESQNSRCHVCVCSTRATCLRLRDYTSPRIAQHTKLCLLLASSVFGMRIT